MFASADLPPELPEEGIQAVVEVVQEELRKIGLYLVNVAVNVDTTEDPADRQHSLLLACSIGSVAFSKRVQEPESDGFDLEFKKIELGTVNDQIADIVKGYQAKGYEIDEDAEDTDSE